jgi:formylglycine-generating enzyme required for sulfatase activity
MDMAGNASEWVADWYNWDGYWNMADRNPISSGPQWNRAMRGSSWYPYGIQDWAKNQSRCSARNSSHHSLPEARVGFRCAYPETQH